MRFGKRDGGARTTKIFYATDVHGSERTWRKFLNAGAFYGADVLIMGGDVMGKLTIPIIREGHDRHRATIHGRVEHLETQAEVERIQERIGFLGFYHTVMDADEYEAVRSDPGAIDRLFVELATERLERWIDLAETKLAGSGIRCYATGGNDDVTEVMAVMDRAGTEHFVGCESRAVQLDDRHIMVSMPYVNPTPWHTPREAPEPELAERIDQIAGDLPDYGHAIFNFHAPPVDSTLDTCPQLDWTTDPPSQIVTGGQPVLYGAGSTSVRRAIERYQPMLGLHGHIHESQAAARLGRTLCINPGSEYGEGVLRGCLITITDGQVKGYQMTAG
ncbi:MAG: metallophosphoesterase [Chloroflexota bacterium]